jgi:hypothetical protein
LQRAGAGCAGIGLQKAWEEAFYWEITPQEKVATAKFIALTKL